MFKMACPTAQIEIMRNRAPLESHGLALQTYYRTTLVNSAIDEVNGAPVIVS
jgi:hypothetical protein